MPEVTLSKETLLQISQDAYAKYGKANDPRSVLQRACYRDGAMAEAIKAAALQLQVTELQNQVKDLMPKPQTNY